MLANWRLQKKFIGSSLLVQARLQFNIWEFLLFLHILNLFKVEEIEEVPLEVLRGQFEAKLLYFCNERLNRILLPLEPWLQLCDLQSAPHPQNSAGFKYEVPEGKGLSSNHQPIIYQLLTITTRENELFLESINDTNEIPGIGSHESKAKHGHINRARLQWNIGHITGHHLVDKSIYHYERKYLAKLKN